MGSLKRPLFLQGPRWRALHRPRCSAPSGHGYPVGAGCPRWARMPPLGPEHPWRCLRRAALRLRWRRGPGLREERRQRGLEDPGSGSPGRLAWVGLSPSRKCDSRVLVQVDPGQAQDQVPLLPPRRAQKPAGALSRFTSSSFRCLLFLYFCKARNWRHPSYR